MGVSGILRKKGWRVTNVKNHHPSNRAMSRHISHIPAIWLQERNATGCLEGLVKAAAAQRKLAARPPTS